jgi:ABC-type branched-subunit amino acid transport system ATPase component
VGAHLASNAGEVVTNPLGNVEIRSVNVTFGGVRALTDVSIAISPGRVHGIIGPNGSGKTTLLNALSGFVRASGGLYLDGHEITRMSPHRRVNRGLGRTFQNPRGDHTLTAGDVLRLGEHLLGLQPWWMVALAPPLADRAWAQSQERARQFLERVGLDESILSTRLVDLPSGVMKMVDIGRAVLGGPRVL